MRKSRFLTAAATSLVATALAVPVDHFSHRQANSGPDVININVTNLHPEDCAFDAARNTWYQSNLYRGKINVFAEDFSHYAIDIPGISSDDLSSPYQLSGVSVNRVINPTRFYAVAKDAHAFAFYPNGTSQSPRGPSAFVAYDLPLSKTSKPAWVKDLVPIMQAFEKKYGVRPFGPVDSAQDAVGNSYVVFALGAPAIAKVTPAGVVTMFAYEVPLASRQPRVGYTGIAYIPSAHKLIAWGGPRALTTFDLSASTPGTPIVAQINGQLDPIASAEKINYVKATDGSGGRLLATNAPYVYSFHSADNTWTRGITFKRYTRDEFKSNGLTTVCKANYNGDTQLYAMGAYFSEGPNSGRQSWPMYKLPASLLTN